jgi:D-arabinose 1-dehydrogenase-like Zn-dependent alcohol dehydrogenase
MKAVRLVQPGSPLELHDIPLPQTGDDDVLVRVKAAGICHSDAHYRAGISRVHPLPLTLGHEVAGVIEAIGRNVKHLSIGERVCLHYMATCGACGWCVKQNEQFCETGAMIGKSRDGGYAEFIAIPARSVFKFPDEIPFEHGAIMMCSSATSLHALNKARMKPGESVAIFGTGYSQRPKLSRVLDQFGLIACNQRLCCHNRLYSQKQHRDCYSSRVH